MSITVSRNEWDMCRRWPVCEVKRTPAKKSFTTMMSISEEAATRPTPSPGKLQNIHKPRDRIKTRRTTK